MSAGVPYNGSARNRRKQHGRHSNGDHAALLDSSDSENGEKERYVTYGGDDSNSNVERRRASCRSSPFWAANIGVAGGLSDNNSNRNIRKSSQLRQGGEPLVIINCDEDCSSSSSPSSRYHNSPSVCINIETGADINSDDVKRRMAYRNNNNIDFLLPSTDFATSPPRQPHSTSLFMQTNTNHSAVPTGGDYLPRTSDDVMAHEANFDASGAHVAFYYQDEREAKHHRKQHCTPSGNKSDDDQAFHSDNDEEDVRRFGDYKSQVCKN